MVYYCVKQMYNDIAVELGCFTYYTTHHKRAETLEQWRRAGGLIIATSALGTGGGHSRHHGGGSYGSAVEHNRFCVRIWTSWSWRGDGGFNHLGGARSD